MFIGQYPDNPVDFGETCDAEGNNCFPNSVIGTTQEFFGVIDPDGFSAFEYRELEGLLESLGGDIKYIFADDFYFVIALPPATVDTGIGAAPIVDMGAYEVGGTVPVNQPLVALPSACPLSGEASLLVQFNSTGSYDPDGTIVSYAWIFGDGGSDSTAAPSYVYTTSGNYTAHPPWRPLWRHRRISPKSLAQTRFIP
jgi:PKD repeat protein